MIKLDINENKYKYKYYVILKVIQEIIFIDDETLNDYNLYKESFLILNKNRDVLYSFSEYIKNEEIKGINMIKLNEKELPFIGTF